MQRNDPVQWAAWGAIAVLALVGTVLGAAPAGAPPLGIPDDALKSGNLAGYEKQIAERVKHWCDQIRNAKDSGVEETVTKARDGLIADYGRAENPNWQFLYAREAAKQLPGILSVTDQYKNLKQVNAAMAAARMTASPIQDALDKLVAHENPAVRYLGWQGYRASRAAVLARGARWTEQMFKTLNDRASKEDSLPVTTAVFRMLRLSSSARPGEVSEKSYRDAQKKAAAVLEGCWQKRCRDVAEGDANLIELCRIGVETWRALGEPAGNDKDLRKKALQGLVDVAWCTARPNLKTGVGDAEAMLLRECEDALSVTKGAKRELISGPLDPKTDPARQRNLLAMAIQEWVSLLKDDGVTDPEQKFKLLSSGPASAPASGPATP